MRLEVLINYLIYLFPFEPNEALITFGTQILPWVYLIGVIFVTVMLFRSKEKPFSIMLFIVPSAILSLIVPLDMAIYCFRNHVDVKISLGWFLIVIAPYLLLLSIISALSGIIETIFRKLPRRSLVITILALLCSFCFYIVLVMYVFTFASE